MYGSERTVFWPSIFIFGIGFIIFASFGKLNAFLGMAACGGWLAFSGVWIRNLDFGNAALISVGIFMIALAVIAILGGVEKR